MSFLFNSLEVKNQLEPVSEKIYFQEKISLLISPVFKDKREWEQMKSIPWYDFNEG